MSLGVFRSPRNVVFGVGQRFLVASTAKQLGSRALVGTDKRFASDFQRVFSKLAQYDCASWAVLEWECALKHPEDGAREGAEFIKRHIICVAEKAFDDSACADGAANRTMLGIS